MPAILVKPAQPERHGSDKERTKKDIPSAARGESGRLFYVPFRGSKQITDPHGQSGRQFLDRGSEFCRGFVAASKARPTFGDAAFRWGVSRCRPWFKPQ